MRNVFSSSPTIRNCAFVENFAKGDGGGLFNYYDSNPVITSCTFAGNSAPNGRAFACDSFGQGHWSSVRVSNCILWDGGDEIWNNDNSVFTITYSNIEGGWPGEGNIDADPCFVEPGYWDPNGTPEDPNDDFWVDGDYHLLPDSPCINAGDPNYTGDPNEADLDGKLRIIGGRIDMGAFEYRPSTPAEVDIDPDTLNLTSRGNWITSLIWLPEDYSVADIDPNSVFLEDEIQADLFQVDEEEQVAIAKFSRSEVQGILNLGWVELTVSGELTDGTVFEGTDVIRVIDKGGRKSP